MWQAVRGDGDFFWFADEEIERTAREWDMTDDRALARQKSVMSPFPVRQKSVMSPFPFPIPVYNAITTSARDISRIAATMTGIVDRRLAARS